MESNLEPKPLTPVEQDSSPAMDEFEIKTSTHKATAKHVIKNAKYILIGLVALLVVGGGTLVVLNLISNQPQVQVASSTPIPTVVPTPTEIPISQLPVEYQDLNQTIVDYQKLINSVDENRTRLNIPIINISISF
jgi:hypothetical protein